MGRTVNRAELAKVFGTSLTTVDDWIRHGCPFLEKPTAANGKKWAFDTAEVANFLLQREREKAVQLTVGLDENSARKRKLAAEAERAELELQKLKGELIAVELVDQAAIDSYKACRSRLLSIPTKLAPTIIAVGNPNEAQEMMENEIYQALNELGNYEEDSHVEESSSSSAEADG